jgi:hypothetical protein
MMIPNAMAKKTATTNETNEDKEDAKATKKSLLKGYLYSPISFTTAQ